MPSEGGYGVPRPPSAASTTSEKESYGKNQTFPRNPAPEGVCFGGGFAPLRCAELGRGQGRGDGAFAAAHHQTRDRLRSDRRRACPRGLRQGGGELPPVARAGLARAGSRGVLLHLCPDDGRPHAVRSDDVLPLRGLPLGRHQETRADAHREGGGPHDPRAQPAGQHRAGLLRLSGQCRDRRHRRARRDGFGPRVRLHGSRRFRPQTVGDPRPCDE